MERYDSYKDSGVKWLGEIPSHWDSASLLYLLRSKISDGPHETPNLIDDGIPFISIDSLNDSKEIDFSVVKKYISSKDYDRYCNKTILEKGDVLFSKAATIGKTAIVGEDKFMVWSPLAILKPNYKKITSLYLYYIMNCKKAIEEVCLLGSKNTQINVGMRELEKIRIPIPTLNEQNAISEFLDQEISKIDAAIAQQQKMIDLLNERKQIIINNAVTKGLDPSVPLINSGIDWIGQIPEGWKVYKIKNLISLLTDYDANGSFSDIAKNCNINTGNPYAWMVRTTDLVNKRFGIVEGNNYCDKSTYDYLAKSSLSPGDLLMTKRGNVGNVYLVPDYDRPMTLAPNLYLLRTLRNKVNNKFLMYFLSSSNPQGQLALLNKSTTLGALYKDDVKALNVVLPPLDVQNSLVDWIEDKIIDIERAIDCIKDMISLLQERKQIIINDVVTGKVKIV